MSISSIANFSTIEDFAKSFVGNWKKFDSFLWYGAPDDRDKYGIIYTHNRDSDILEKSNAEEIEKRLSPFMNNESPDVISESHNHWACGYVEGYAIRVYDAQGNITQAIREIWTIAQQLANYPVLNEEDYSEKEEEEKEESWQSWIANDYKKEVLKSMDPFDFDCQGIPADTDMESWFGDFMDNVPADTLRDWFNEDNSIEIESDGGYVHNMNVSYSTMETIRESFLKDTRKERGRQCLLAGNTYGYLQVMNE